MPRRGEPPTVEVMPRIPSTRPVTAAELRFDAILAAALAVGAVISVALMTIAGFYGERQASLPVSIIYAIAVTAPLAFRRRFPCTVAVIVCVLFFLGGTFHIPELYAGNIAMFIALYTVGAWVTDRQRAAIVRIVLSVGMIVWLLVAVFIESTADTDDGLSRVGIFSPFLSYSLLQILVNLLYFSGAYYMGDRAYAAAREREALEERTRELEREKERTAAQAVALDRVRIARELHDVVAHHVSAMGVQAGAARAVMDRDPHAARSALTGIETSARTAISDLRNLLGTLRTKDSEEAPSTLGIGSLPELVEHAETHGLPTSLSIIGEPFDLPALTEVNLYRITQEALTNARRHGGPAATADVRVRYLDDCVELEVVNTGRPLLRSHTGLGLVGMRERAAASGGTIDLRGRENGFLVRARLPREGATA